MTREEAIEIIKNRSCYECAFGCFSVYDCKCSDEGCDYKRAIKYLVNTLEQEPITKNDLVVDCIPRKVMRDLGATCIAYRNDKQQLIPIISIDELPSVTPQEPKIGHWIDNTELGYHVSICSCCEWRGHGDVTLIYRPNYCPNCGAKMESEDKE